MQRVLVSVEGQTEEIFVRDILAPHLIGFGIALQQVILKTKRPAGAAPGRGGMSRWSKVSNELRLLLRDSGASTVTTMYDLYGLPTDTPGWEHALGITDPHERAGYVEEQIKGSVGDE